jgi:hypothetical protein
MAEIAPVAIKRREGMAPRRLAEKHDKVRQKLGCSLVVGWTPRKISDGWRLGLKNTTHSEVAMNRRRGLEHVRSALIASGRMPGAVLLRRRPVDQRSDEAQQLLVLRAMPAGQKRPDLDVRFSASRGEVGLVLDEHPAGIGIACELPSVAAAAAVEFSRLQGHV